MNEIFKACDRILALKLADSGRITAVSSMQRWRNLEDFLAAASTEGLLDSVGPDGSRIPGGARDEVFAYAKSWNLFSLTPDFEISSQVREVMPTSKVREARIIPLRLHDNRLYCAVSDPSDFNKKASIQARTNWPVELQYASEQTLDLLIERFYSTHHEATVQGALATKQAGFNERATVVQAQDATHVQQTLNAIIEGALQQGEADIHIDHFLNHLEVRYGKGSNLRHYNKFPLELGSRIANVIRAKAKITNPDFECQNGTLTHTWQGIEYSLRVGVLPATFGPSITLRLGQDRAWNLDEIGMNEATYNRWTSVTENKSGLFIVTGPMGSGKTVLLQATAARRAGVNRKIVTLEAPIEYRFPQYVTQVQVESGQGRDWNDIMPTVLRSAASTILLGEINRQEIGHTAVEAANTGHQVFSTLHTNDAVTSITRLREFGILPSVLSDVMRAVCAQRLVETLCEKCKVPRAPSERHLELFQVDDATITGTDWFEKNPTGCDRCGGSGIGGRAPIHELMTFDEAVRDLVAEEASSRDIREAAVAAGMVPLADSALNLAIAGRTSLSLAREEITF